MPFVTENVESRELNVEAGKRGTDLKFDIVEATDEAAAELALLDVLPALLPNGQRLQSYRLSTQGAGIWQATASYKSGNDAADGSGGGSEGGAGGGASVTFDTTGGTVRVTQGLGTVGAYVPPDVSGASTFLAAGVTKAATDMDVLSSAGFPAPPFRASVGGELVRVTAVNSTAWTVERNPNVAAAHEGGAAVKWNRAPDYHDAIGVTLDAVEGTDVTLPTYAFSETYTFPLAAVNETYRATLFQLTGTVNDATFRGLERGECLFLGASGSRRGNDDVEITFKFAGSANRRNFKVGSIAVEEKLGWDYLWVRYLDKVVDQALVKQPKAVFVERVYKFANFDLLGIS